VLKISKQILGTKSDIYVLADGSVLTDSSESSEFWSYGSGSGHRAVETACTALGIDAPQIIDEDLKKFWASWGVTPPGAMIMSREQLTEKIKDLNRWFTTQFAAHCDSSYFCNDFQSILRLIDRLEPALLDEDFVSTCSDERISSLSGAKHVYTRYDPLSSVTGRLTVKSGFPILTLPRDLRRCLRPRHGKILQLDFTALEPHTLRCFAGIETPADDIYTDVGSGSGLDRDVVKVAVMSACYGMSKNSFRSKFKQVKNPGLFYDLIRERLGVEKLEKIIMNNVTATGISNGFGRPIQCEQSSWISHFVQSTAVDVACQGFNDVIDRLAGTAARFSPLFVIHDSLVLDINIEHERALRKIAEEGFTLESRSYKFPMKIKDLY
jgi:hypothetical protein